MKIGFCTGMDRLALAREAGCDYAELGFASVTQMSGEAYQTLLHEVKRVGLPVEAMNGFLPADFPLCRPISWEPVLAFVEKGMARARELGVSVVVFGSSGARGIPQDIQHAVAMTRLTEFSRLAGDVAGRYGVEIAIEPLCHAECNSINTFAEGLSLAQRAAHPHVRCLADLYHMGQNGEDLNDLLKGASWLIHCHIAWPDKRTYPLPEDGYDYSAFFRPLRAIGYDARVSVEASAPHGPQDLAASIRYLKELTV